MIVKVQISLFDSDKRILVYNKDESVMYEDKAPKEIIKRMKGKDKAYFKAHIKFININITDFPKIIILDEMVEDQNW